MLEDANRKRDQLRLSREILERETVTGSDHTARLASVAQDIAAMDVQIEKLNTKWGKEKELVEKIQNLTAELQGTNKTTSDPAAEPDASAAAPNPLSASSSVSVASAKELTKQELLSLKKQLTELQGESPLVHPFVDRNAIAETVAAWTGIPVGRMMSDEINTILTLHEMMEKQVVGQSHALMRIAQSIRTSRAQLNDPRAPIGVFMLAGTSGVGKTETAMALAQLLYGGEQNMTVINMSEFKEEHKVSMLMGSPPGYVGYGEGGVLTEAVRRKPYSVILLDEMEKAHPGVQDIFYQVFDKGNMKDGEGRDIDFKNTLIIMTTNAGTDVIKSLCSDPDTIPEPDDFMQAIFPELLKSFKPAFMGRLTLIPYYPLADHVIRKIIGLKLGKIGKRVQENYNAQFSFTDELVQLIADRCTEVDTGARNIDHILTKSLLPELSSELLSRLAAGQDIQSVKITVTPDQTFAYEIA
jgi:type VI secretion system protein VasG